MNTSSIYFNQNFRPLSLPNNAFIDEIFSRNESQWFCAQNVRIGILNFVLIFSGGGKIFWQKRISPAIKKSDQNSNLSAESLAFILRKDYLINASLGEIWGSKVLVTIYRRRVHSCELCQSSLKHNNLNQCMWRQ